MQIETRTAPRNGRLCRPSPDQLAVIDSMIARAAKFEQAPAPGPATRFNNLATAAQAEPPAPDAPPATNPPDVYARLDAQDASLQDHEQRIAALEERSPPPQGLNDGAGQTPAEARAARNLPAMVDAGALYAKMRARPTGQKAAAALPAMPQAIQTSAGPLLDARAIHKRQNAVAAARAGRAA